MKYSYNNPVDKNIINVVQYGLGPIGISTARTAITKDMVYMVGAVDVDPEKVGKDLGQILDNDSVKDILVVNNIQEIYKVTDVDIVLHTTSSFLDKTFDQFKEIMEGGANIVSSTEEMSLPDLRNPKMAKELDVIAKHNNVSCLGTGVNPGFVMDSLSTFLTSMCNRVDHVHAERVVDASTRREPLQRKIGAGLSISEFNSLANAGKLGHIGLKESIAFIAKGMGWEVDSFTETIDPIVAETDIKTKYFEVKKGEAAGINNIGTGSYKNKELIKLELRMYAGAKNPHDAIKISGDPGLNVIIDGGVAGDTATVASLVNNIPRVIQAQPGLLTMMDLSMPRIFNGKCNY